MKLRIVGTLEIVTVKAEHLTYWSHELTVAKI